MLATRCMFVQQCIAPLWSPSRALYVIRCLHFSVFLFIPGLRPQTRPTAIYITEIHAQIPTALCGLTLGCSLQSTAAFTSQVSWKVMCHCSLDALQLQIKPPMTTTNDIATRTANHPATYITHSNLQSTCVCA